MEVMNCSSVGSTGFLGEEKSVWDSPCGGVDGGVGGRAEEEACSHLITLPALTDRYAIISLVTGRRTNSSRAALRDMVDIVVGLGWFWSWSWFFSWLVLLYHVMLLTKY